MSQIFPALGSFAIETPFSSPPLSLGSMVSSDIGLGAGWRRGLVSDGGEAYEVFGVFAMGVKGAILFVSPS